MFKNKPKGNQLKKLYIYLKSEGSVLKKYRIHTQLEKPNKQYYVFPKNPTSQ